jgi:hypothetical protein
MEAMRLACVQARDNSASGRSTNAASRAFRYPHAGFSRKPGISGCCAKAARRRGARGSCGLATDISDNRYTDSTSHDLGQNVRAS